MSGTERSGVERISSTELLVLLLALERDVRRWLNCAGCAAGWDGHKSDVQESLTLLDDYRREQAALCPDCSGKGWMQSDGGDATNCSHCGGRGRVD